MRATLEAKAADDFLSPKATSDEAVMEGAKPAIETLSKETTDVDLLGVTVQDGESSVNGSSEAEEKSRPSSQIHTPNGVDSTTERVKELESKLTEKDSQYKELEATLTTRTNELGKQKSDHEEKMKKMKAIFAAANKNLNEYRQSIAAKDEEIAELKARLEQPQQDQEASAEQSRKWEMAALTRGMLSVTRHRLSYSNCKILRLIEAVLDLETELKNQSELSASKLAQMVYERLVFFLLFLYPSTFANSC